MDKSSTLKVKLLFDHENNLVQLNMVTKLESELLKIEVDVVDAQAKAVMSRTNADKKVAVYFNVVDDAPVEHRRDLDNESRSKEYSQYKSLRETLQEIHDRGFHLTEEVKQAKVDEHDTRTLFSDTKDREKEADWP